MMRRAATDSSAPRLAECGVQVPHCCQPESPGPSYTSA